MSIRDRDRSRGLRIFTASLGTETNTFSAIPTGLTSFQELGLFRGDGSVQRPDEVGAGAALVQRLAKQQDHQVIESLSAWATPAGKTVSSVYENLSEQVLEDLTSAGPVDVVMLFLHGAMVAEGYDDCEGDLLSRIRHLTGPDTQIGAVLDLHCHLTERMIAAADAFVIFKEYPHTDEQACGVELYHILTRAARGEIRPTMAVHECRMNGIWQTMKAPMSSFVAAMRDAEKASGVLSLSLVHGFPWGDVPEAGAKMLAVTDGDDALAAELAAEFASRLWAIRESIGTSLVSVTEALDIAAQHAGRSVIADVADNAGGGAPSDSTFVLREIIARQLRDVAFGAMWDPGAISLCVAAGVGASLRLRIGGKLGVSSGAPLDVEAVVQAIVAAHSQRAFSIRQPLGTCVWIRLDGCIDVLLASIRDQIFGLDAFTGIGIELAAKKVVVVKSLQHFLAEFQAIADRVIYVSTPGALSCDFATLDYEKRSLNYWPRVDDPFAEATV